MTVVLGVFGDPVGHSLSPLMHNRALEALGVDGVYIPFRVRPSDLRAALCGVAALRMAGVNLTIPHKEAAIPHLDELSEEARRIGAVNTVQQVGGKLIGHNTDGRGFVRSLKEETGIEPKGVRFLLVGAGGAVRAVAVQLGLDGADRLVIANRTAEKAVSLARRVTEATGARAEGIGLDDERGVREAAAEADVVINGTPVGMGSGETDEKVPEAGPAALPIPLTHVRPGALVCDLVYTPRRTSWLRAAAEAGHPTLSGAGMLLFQGAIALEIWTGLEAPIGVMRRALDEALA